MGVGIGTTGSELDGGISLDQESINTAGTTTNASVSTGETAIVISDAKAIDIAPSDDDGGVYFYGFESGAKTASTGKRLDRDRPLGFYADYGERLNFTLYISRQSGTGTILIDELSIT